jgi:hypothetical protein
MANRCEQPVGRITNRNRNPEEDGGEPPGEREATGDPQRGRRSQEDLPIFNEHDAPRALPRETKPCEQFSGARALRRTKAEVPFWISRGDEPDRPFAERAGAVEENNRCHDHILTRVCERGSRPLRSRGQLRA